MVNSVLPSYSQELPHHVKRAAPSDAVVYDIELNYDFTLIKRDAGDVYIRLDYSNMPNYWDEIVQAKPPLVGRSLDAEILDRRWWSSRLPQWRSKIDRVRAGDAERPVISEQIDVTLFDANQANQCKSDNDKAGLSPGDDGFLKARIVGLLDARMRFGFTFVGKLSPVFELDEAYGFFDTSVDLNAQLDFDGKGKLAIHGDAFAGKSIFGAPLTAYGFSHPGIVSLSPSLDVLATVIGQGEIDGKFVAELAGGNGFIDDRRTFTTQGQPESLNQVLDDGGPGNFPELFFDGYVIVSCCRIMTDEG